MNEIVFIFAIWAAFITGCVVLFVSYCFVLLWATDRVWQHVEPPMRHEFVRWLKERRELKKERQS